MTIADEFAEFYQVYPRHVGKLGAARAYKTARKTASAQEILDGLRRYMLNKPQWQEFCYPATFLNQGRWMDEPDRPAHEWICPHTPRCTARHACHVLLVCGR